jgi:prephenate dehydratase
MRFGDDGEFIPAPTIFDEFEFVKMNPGSRAVAPIENSSGGQITSTVDLLLNDPELTIVESMTLVVRLAFLGRKGAEIKTLYSHFAPFKHCATWIRENLPNVECHEVSSTAEAAIRAVREKNAAALGSRKLADIYDLDILTYPVAQDAVNETEFIVVTSRETRGDDTKGDRSSLAVELLNGPGSLCSFLTPFKDEAVNLTRIISRPVYGVPSEYAFFIDIKGNGNAPTVKKALNDAAEHCDLLRIIGSYSHAGKFHS